VATAYIADLDHCVSLDREAGAIGGAGRKNEMMLISLKQALQKGSRGLVERNGKPLQKLMGLQAGAEEHAED
jgi:hypothetical protein